MGTDIVQFTTLESFVELELILNDVAVMLLTDNVPVVPEGVA